MKRWTYCAAALMLWGLAADAHANGPRPPLPPPVNPMLLGARNAELVVEVDENARDARLQIPMKLLAAPPRPVKLGADGGRIPTLVAGLALTCAFVSGGFWLVRRGRSRTLAAVLTLTLLAAGTTAVVADIAVPKPVKPPVLNPTTPVALPADIKLSGKVVLEVVQFGDKIKLIVPKNMVPKVDKPKE